MKIKKPTLPKVKMNMVVGKRQIVLAALVMGLGCAVYLNWEYTKMDTNIDTAVAETGKNYGDAQFVSSEEEDAYFAEAGKLIIDKEKASIGMLQRMFKIGFNRAARIMDQLAEAGVVGPEEGTKPRKVLMTKEEFDTYLEENGS